MKIVEKGYAAADKETNIVFDYLSNEWIVYSNVPSHITKLSKRYPENIVVVEELPNGKPVLIKCKLPKQAVSFRKPMSQETRKKLKKNGLRLQAKNVSV